ncbi:uncharacterized protein HGUI_03658 [Hanseniaspora guilliermondii]|uniref:SWR1-complex protein 5 n=1 Tax=Hanseniaspora guilliermondii TaxID=56406 RepID=A0A1L0CS88_9ASCO|nr:uncharacterized protein HGUI_03658 [Hanseniaspora guilliermondii]
MSNISDNYNSDDDLDYNPNLNTNNDSDLDEEDLYDLNNNISSAVKTRRSAKDDENDLFLKKQLDKFGNILIQDSHLSNTIDVDNILNKLNNLTHSVYKQNDDNSHIDILNAQDDINLNNIMVKNNKSFKVIEKVKIKRKYKFAGKIHDEEIEVPKDSAMAKEYFNSLKFDDVNEKIENDNTENIVNKKSNLIRPLKRKSILQDIINGKNSQFKNLSTLEKSKIDWANYVDKSKINHEELKEGWAGNKGGFLERQRFLESRDSVR